MLLTLETLLKHWNILSKSGISSAFYLRKLKKIKINKNDLNKIHQTTSSIEDLYDENKKLNFSNTFHSQNYIFSHKENFVINSDVI